MLQNRHYKLQEAAQQDADDEFFFWICGHRVEKNNNPTQVKQKPTVVYVFSRVTSNPRSDSTSSALQIIKYHEAYSH